MRTLIAKPVVRLAGAICLAAAASLQAKDRAGVAAAWGPREPPFVPARPIAIVGGSLIDATGAAPKRGYAVVIEGDTITRVGPAGDVAVPDGARIIDADGMTVMPGIINSNQHLQLNPLYPASTADLPLEVLKARWEETFARMPRRAFVYLMQGVTSMRQTSGPRDRLLSIKKRIDSGEIAGPRIFLGGALFMSVGHFESYIRDNDTPESARDWLRNEFAYNVIEDVDRDTERFLGPDFNYWKLYLSDEIYDGENDFTDEQLRFLIDKAHDHGKMVDLHAGGHNEGLRRMLAFDVDTLEHPFYGSELIEEDVIEGYVKNDVIVATLLTVMVAGAERAMDPHRFSETLYAMSMEPREYRILMRYRDKMLFNRRHPDRAGLAVYERSALPDAGETPTSTDAFGLRGPSFNEMRKMRDTSRENMRRFIRAGARFSMGTDTPSFLNFQQEDPNAAEFGYMVEMGMTPMEAVLAATRNGAAALGMLDRLGTIEEGKLADVIVVDGDPLSDPDALKRVYAVIKGGVRYK